VTANVDQQVVSGFGDEWSRFDQSALSEGELRRLFDNYFNIFPWHRLPKDAVGFDLGCGSGRWARFVAPMVGKLHLIDPSEEALSVARRNLRQQNNCEFHLAGAGDIPLAVESCDFGYSLGVLHHIPDTEAGLSECVTRLKSGAPFLLYLYYSFDNRPTWFRAVWKLSDIVRKGVSRLPSTPRYVVSQFIAAAVYFPLARGAKILERLRIKVDGLPLAQYRNDSFYIMRNDALDRFGTRLERRFSKEEIRGMMERCGLAEIEFSTTSYWTAVGVKR
jgi:SAM-dependent methyltransferase